MNTPSEPPARPSLETLLRLKRSERPDPDFWMEFELRMKQKQLAAMVEPRPWWLELSLVARRFSPLGGVGLAGGVALLAMIALLNDAQHAGGASPSPGSAARVASMPGPLAPVQESAGGRVSEPSRDFQAFRPPTAVASAEAIGVGGTSKPVNGHPGNVISEFLESAALRAVEMIEASGSAGGAVVQAASGIGGNVLDPVVIDKRFHGYIDAGEDFALDESVPVLVPTGTADESMEFSTLRQARLLAVASESLVVSDSKSLAQVRDRVIHRMSEGESLYASISRLGVSGDRLSVKF